MSDFPGKENHKDYCAYHKDKGHRTGFCRALRRLLEDLVEQGYLKEFVQETKVNPAEEQPRAQRDDQRRRREEPEGGDQADEVQQPQRARARRDAVRPAVINVIHMKDRPQSVIACPRTDDVPRTREEEILEVNAPPTKRLRGESGRGITFHDDESSGVKRPHNDALVVTLKMFETDVRRILIDAESSTEVMFLSLFKKLGLTQEDLEPA